MTRAMTRSSSPPRLASLGVLLWAATSLAMPLDTPTGPAHETDGIAAHGISLQPAARDFERRRRGLCKKSYLYEGKSCCKRFLLDKHVTKTTKCEAITYRGKANCNCHQYFYYLGRTRDKPHRTMALQTG